MPIDQDRIKQLISIIEANGLTELAVEEEGLSITIRAEPDVEPRMVTTPVTEVSVGLECQVPDMDDSSMGVDVPVDDETQLFRIESPMTGVFYRTPAPDQPHYVEVGDEIEVGQTIGLIEAMKVFSEVPSEVSGIVVDIPAPSGKLVQSGDVLVVVDTSAT